eukprot:Blabericola_migrator_1__10242@NODE_572_length_7517_cov_232_454094_g426_i0_p3_GENE_NODE_572_length_7517_cov_232_454094_g426_i0NODE_572_length_7517_cov_232_454094_g426_i0_p3_ORF_typecomplete_len416_score51_49OSTHTH/PF12872_7/6_8e07SH3_2/PF07653_17/0_0043zfC3HC4_4/PF15227_6/0_0094SH3_9/PF14604_6/0_017zfC3HC4_3/PF13920_6/0_033zfRING_UBOX/PF13445_6/0_07zfRING_6/PF14835_6/0_081zfC3HC4_2/PF13923_6/0_8zfRING_5/PF14634_6/1_8zfC3HC4/PF00097_25/1_3ProkRING_4/PF14447_6/1_3ProkRING_4/PF14447_6/1e04_NODE_572_
MQDKLARCRATIRRLRVLCQYGAEVSSLPNEYRASYGEPIGYQDFGYMKLSDFLSDHTEELEIRSTRDGRLLVFPRGGVTEEDRAIRAQPVMTTSFGSGDGFQMSFPPRRVEEAHMLLPFSDLICPGCGFLSNDPVLFGCGHFSCFACLRPGSERWCRKCQQESPQVVRLEPAVSDTTTIASLKGRLLTDIFRLPISCPYWTQCSWRGYLGEVQTHELFCAGGPHKAGRNPVDGLVLPSIKDSERILKAKGVKELPKWLRMGIVQLLKVVNGVLDGWQIYRSFDPMWLVPGEQDKMLRVTAGDIVSVVRHRNNTATGYTYIQKGLKAGWVPTACLQSNQETGNQFIDRLKAHNWDLQGGLAQEPSRETFLTTPQPPVSAMSQSSEVPISSETSSSLSLSIDSDENDEETLSSASS